MDKVLTLEEQVIHDYYAGYTVMQIVNEYRSRYECTKQEAIEKIYSILKSGFKFN